MRVPIGAIPGYMQGGEYSTPLPPSNAILGAMSDPVAAYLLSPNNPEGLGRLLLDDAVGLLRTITARGATQIGIPTSMLGGFEGVLSAAIDRDWAELATAGVQTALDVAMQALGAVPIVGWLARGAISVVRGMVMVANQGDPPDMVPLAVYDKALNDWYASRALDVVGDAGAMNTDWTPLFDVPGTGAWVGIRGDPRGYVFHLQGYDRHAQAQTTQDLGAGKALVPGLGLGLVQINVDFPEPVAINRFEIPHAAYFVGSRTYDKTETLPSYLRVGVGAWQSVGSRTPALFQVNVSGLAQRWREYVEGALEVADAFEHSNHGDADVRGVRRNAGYFARTMLYDFDIMQEYGSPLFLADGTTRDLRNNWWGKAKIRERIQLPSSRRLDKLASEKLADLYKRQNAALDTIMVAYCSEKQPAFEATSLRNKLQARRRELLRHPAVAQVNLDDVPDADYRSLLYTARFSPGFGLTARPGHRIAHPFGPLDAIPEGSPWDALGSAKGPARVLGQGLLLAGGVYGVYRLAKWLGDRYAGG